jgi:subtilase family serine protease
MHKRSIATSIVAATALTVGALIASPGAGASPSSTAVPNSTPRWLSHAQHLGKASSAASASFRVYLTPRGGVAALQAAAARVSTPGSAQYRQFISAAQYHASYDPTSANVASVTRWLASNRLAVTGVEAHNRYISVRGSVSQVQRAFGVSIDTFKHNGTTVQANTSALKVPTGIAGLVQTVTGIDTTPKVVKPAQPAPPPASFVNARPCSASYGQVLANKQADFHTPLPKFRGKYLPYAICGYTGPQYRAAYENNSALDGTGITVAITDAYAAPTIRSDANTYAVRHGDGAYQPGQLRQVVPSSFNSEDVCDASGWYGEETLDVEAVHAMAPGANIRYYASSSCFDSDFLTTLAKVVDQNVAQLVTNSWSDVEANESTDTIAAYEDIFLQGALQGISFMFSSGDNGDELANTGLLQADYPASDPYATAVGGTSDAIGADGQFKFQTGWGTNRYDLSADGSSWTFTQFLYGAGGGFSNLFNRPTYQDGVVPASSPPGRAVPDVGLDADPTTGMLIGETQTFPSGVHYGEYRIGGTSLASPLFAGMTALLLQHAGGGLGLLNPVIYNQFHSGTFTDIKGTPPDSGNVRVDYINGNDPSGGLRYTVRTFNEDSSLRIRRGWDDVTGVGSPNPGWLTSVSP